MRSCRIVANHCTIRLEIPIDQERHPQRRPESARLFPLRRGFGASLYSLSYPRVFSYWTTLSTTCLGAGFASESYKTISKKCRKNVRRVRARPRGRKSMRIFPPTQLCCIRPVYEAFETCSSLCRKSVFFFYPHRTSVGNLRPIPRVFWLSRSTPAQGRSVGKPETLTCCAREPAERFAGIFFGNFRGSIVGAPQGPAAARPPPSASPAPLPTPRLVETPIPENLPFRAARGTMVRLIINAA